MLIIREVCLSLAVTGDNDTPLSFTSEGAVGRVEVTGGWKKAGI